jgi:hypothetical protein
VRDKVETQCPRCKQRNAMWRSDCRLCGASLRVGGPPVPAGTATISPVTDPANAGPSAAGGGGGASGPS